MNARGMEKIVADIGCVFPVTFLLFWGLQIGILFRK